MATSLALCVLLLCVLYTYTHTHTHTHCCCCNWVKQFKPRLIKLIKIKWAVPKITLNCKLRIFFITSCCVMCVWWLESYVNDKFSFFYSCMYILLYLWLHSTCTYTNIMINTESLGVYMYLVLPSFLPSPTLSLSLSLMMESWKASLSLLPLNQHWLPVTRWH